MTEHSKSILQEKECCFICGTTNELHRHHVFYGTANRKVSEEDGCWIWLCGPHHNMSNYGIHFNKDLDDKVKQFAEKKWIETYASDLPEDEQIKAFIKRYGRNYL